MKQLRVALSLDDFSLVTSLEEASRAVREYIEACGIGSTDWYADACAGEVRCFAGKLVARISYNGRMWNLDGTESSRGRK